MEEIKGAESMPQVQTANTKIWAWLFAIAGLLVAAGLVWASDWITMQNERTIYTVDCAGGAWQGRRCNGRLKAGDRYRFRALRARGEVLFWVVGSGEPSGKLAPCAITSGRNWTCKTGPDAAHSITLQMSMGRAVISSDGATKSIHAVPKWRWYLLRWGIAVGHSAEN
ncbi:hypothetical protein [Variovorax sp. Sphag1AA]|uniref:hypothetical protein n=1 Tax=Variovorax sp. Sphag1AA TaxID=2587027 RepID=UPI001622A67E|nr:hypothetical protein [Variovorax sp. Sphag1AA]MBB3178044.1 hypothetical protein [Variovorax sp. Sphag1AA]